MLIQAPTELRWRFEQRAPEALSAPLRVSTQPHEMCSGGGGGDGGDGGDDGGGGGGGGGESDDVFLRKAALLAERMLPAFDTPSGLPYSDVNPACGTAHGPLNHDSAIVAEAGSLALEWRLVGRLTGRAKFEQAVERADEALAEAVRSGGAATLDGLVPGHIAPSTGVLLTLGAKLTAGGYVDSYYEYLLKGWLQMGKAGSGQAFGMYRERYEAAQRGMLRHLLVRSGEGLTFLQELVLTGVRASLPSWVQSGRWSAAFSSLSAKAGSAGVSSGGDGGGGVGGGGGGGYTKRSGQMDHLTCFVPGMLALAWHHGAHGPSEGPELLRAAEELMATCYAMYTATPTRLAPEITHIEDTGLVRWPDDKGLRRGAMFIKHGDDHCLLRPETVESLFVLWRTTGNATYREWGWAIFEAFEKHARVPSGGYASIHSVLENEPRWRKDDKMETWLLSETFKYLYLLFSDEPELISLDRWVFNTEGHPLPILSHRTEEQGESHQR